MDGEKIKIKNIICNSNPCVMAEGVQEDRERAAGRNATVTTVGLGKGPAGMECSYEEAMAAPYILEQVILAEKEGYQAVTLDCAGDPLLMAARERVKIPVVGPGEAGMLFAMGLGERISIITVSPTVQWIRRNFKTYGFINWVASIKAVTLSLQSLIQERERTEKALIEVGRKAMEEDRAEVILLGCTGMSKFAPGLAEVLGIPVLDPASCALKMAVDLVEMGLSHSKRSYPFPPPRGIKG